MKAVGERGADVFTSPSTAEQDVLDRYGVAVVGRTPEIDECFFVISAERCIKRPAVSAITEAALQSGSRVTSPQPRAGPTHSA